MKYKVMFFIMFSCFFCSNIAYSNNCEDENIDCAPSGNEQLELYVPEDDSVILGLPGQDAGSPTTEGENGPVFDFGNGDASENDTTVIYD